MNGERTSANLGPHRSQATEIVVRGRFTAQHLCAEPVEHEHSWSVEAYFATPAPADARCYLASLDTLLGGWNGKSLPANIQTNEQIAATVGLLVNCVEVVVFRDAERIGARWRA